VLYSTTTPGNLGEVLNSFSSNLTTGNFQQHRFAIQGQGHPITVAQAQFNVAVTGINEEQPRTRTRACMTDTRRTPLSSRCNSLYKINDLAAEKRRLKIRIDKALPQEKANSVAG